MKKAFLCMLVFASLCCGNAFAEVNIEKDECRCTVTADCAVGETVTMIVAKKNSTLADDDIIAVREGKGDEKKIAFIFEFENTAAYEGEYTVYVMNNGSNTKSQKDFVHALDSSIDSASGALEAVTDSELEALLNGTHQNAFKAMGMNYERYNECTESQKQVIRDMFMAEKGTLAADDLIKLINRSIAVTMINNGGNTEDALVCAMPEFEGITYEKADDDLKLWLKDVMRGNYSTTKDFEDRYNEACMLYKFNTARFSQFSTLFSTYASALKITDNASYKKYSALTDNVKSAVGDKLVDQLKLSVKSTDALMTVLGKACDEAIAEKNAGTNSASLGGGGGSGSGVVVSGGVSGSTPQPVPQNNSYTKYKDTGSVSWAEKAINVLSERNVISGDGDGNFRPNDPVTRAEFAKMLITAIGGVNEGAVSKFTDLDKDAWYYKYVSSAYEAGIVSGVSETEFGVGNPITRQEMAVMISRALKIYKEIPITREKIEFTDKDEIADWAKDDVDTLYCTGIMSGLGDGAFEPRSGATRAQAALVVYNLIK